MRAAREKMKHSRSRMYLREQRRHNKRRKRTPVWIALESSLHQIPKSNLVCGVSKDVRKDPFLQQ